MLQTGFVFLFGGLLLTASPLGLLGLVLAAAGALVLLAVLLAPVLG